MFRVGLFTHGLNTASQGTHNAVAESFFDTLKVELVYRYKFASRNAARTILADYIEEFYNVNRIHSTLAFFSPAEYENLMSKSPKDRVH